MNVAQWEIAHVQRFGSHAALVIGDRTWTNGDLYDRACRLAGAFVARGLQPGDRVIVALPSCYELFISCSAVWRAGGVLVLAPHGPAAEVERVAADCEPALILRRREPPIHRDRGSMDRSHAIECLRVADDVRCTYEELASFENALAEPVPRSAEDIAQLCYTSGTTGNPKGVVYTHGGIDAFWRAHAAASPSRVLLLGLPPTAFGGRLTSMRVVSDVKYVVVDPLDPETVFAAIERHAVTELPVVPAMAEQLVAFRASRRYDVSSLRSINVGGAHVSRALVAQLEKRFGGSFRQPRDRAKTEAALGLEQSAEPTILVIYGMTETGGGCASTTRGGDGLVGPVSPGAVVRIVGPDGVDVAPGRTGEILVKTPYAATGYWRNPDATAQVFRDGFVHTGDVGRFDEARELHVLGRIKELVIQGGQNIYPEEIAGAVRALDGVRECAVVGIPDDLLGEVAVACVVREPGARITERAVRSHCRERLNRRKLPGQVIFVDELPRTPVGKVRLAELREIVASSLRRGTDQRLLADLARASAHARIGLLAATIEHELCELLPPDEHSDALESGISFGEMSLDSIAIVELAYSLSRRLGERISPTVLFTYPTVAALSEHLGADWSRNHRGGARDERAPTRSDPDVTAVDDPIAIVGIGCRLPGGVATPDELWALLRDGVDTVRTAPEGRARGGSSWRAAFVDAIDAFDARFFGLAAEAAEIDPRHRLLLEVAWEAFENAGCNPLALRPESTGAFLGIYGERYPSSNPLGSAPGMAVARLCHFLDLRGPVASIDTTCSSSLVAIHYAAESLRRGDCEIAVAGGVNMLAAAAPHDGPLGLIAADGRSKAFAADADGFGQGEGCVLVVLKRLPRALADRDRIYATIRATAINHDGRSSSLTAPNARAQAEVISRALRRAGLTPDDVQYVEAHGTGTALGDPIEVEGLRRVLGRRATPALAIGSVKTNTGHLEAAAGALGLAKLALAIFHRALPPSLHAATPSPEIPWHAIPIRVQSEFGAWPRQDAPLIGGVSSFGMSGTNAHAVLAEAPADAVEEPLAAPSPVLRVLPLSAKSFEALNASTERYAAMLEGPNAQTRFEDVAYSAGCRRAHFDHRVAVVGATGVEWAAELRKLARADDSIATSHGREPRRKAAIVFSGQGPQWWGMAHALFGEEPVFRDAIERCAACVDPLVSWRLVDELMRSEADSRLARTDFAQPALFALQVGLYELWRSWGVEPVAVVGHSLGEIAAAHVAGALSLDQAATLACERGRIMQKAAGTGAMAHVGLAVLEAQRLVERFAGQVEIAAVNGPTATTLTGDPRAVSRAIEIVRARGFAAQRLPVDRAFHSRGFDEAARELTSALCGLPVAGPTITFVSTVTGRPASTLDATYWGAQMRSRVELLAATRTLLDRGCDVFLEVGPHPVLAPALEETIREHAHAARAVVVIPSQRRESPGRRGMLDALARLYCAGYAVDWSRQHAAKRRAVTLPTYAWQRRSYWHAAAPSERRARIGPLVHAGLRSAAAPDTYYYESEIDLGDAALAYLAAHRILGDVWFPASAYLELVWEAAQHAYGAELSALEDVELENALVLTPERSQHLQVVFDGSAAAARAFRVYSRDESGQEVTRHARGSVRLGMVSNPPADLALDALRRGCTIDVDLAALSARFADAGVGLGDDFDAVAAAWAGDGAVVAKLRSSAPLRDLDAYAVHPALLDIAFRLGAAASLDSSFTAAIPAHVAAMRVFAPNARVAWTYTRLADADAQEGGDVCLFDDAGRVIAEARGLVARRIPAANDGVDRGLYTVEWRPAAAPEATAVDRTWLVLNDRGDIGVELSRALAARGARVLSVEHGSDYRRSGDRFELRIDASDHLQRLISDLRDGPRPTAIVHLASLDVMHGDDAAPALLERASRRGVLSAMHLVQQLLRTDWTPLPRLVLVTRGAQGPGDVRALAQAPLWGFGATLAREYPDFNTKLIDLDPEQLAIELLCAELGATDREDRVALRAGRRFVARLCAHRARTPARVKTSLQVGDDGYAVDMLGPGRFDSIRLRRVARVRPKSREVEVRVRASALNFRDVLIALGRYPASGGIDLIGGECSGVVERIGPEVTELEPGDEVVVTGTGLLRAFATVPLDRVWRKPRAMTFAEAASVSVAFATALFALERVGRVRDGERVLIHSAAGGVGLAAIQYCKRVGARVLATAGSARKRELLRELGAPHVFDSRDLSWIDGVRNATCGAGVDVVLNSLSGEALVRGFDVLAPGGRFLELGKQDIHAGTSLPLSVFRRNAAFCAASLDVLDPDALRELHAEVWRRFAAGFFTPLPVETLPISQVGEAFHRMARAQHVGKIVLMAESAVDVEQAAIERLVRRDRTYLITGGCGALGLVVARRLARCGARYLVLAGRTAPNERAARAIEALRAEGVEVRPVTVDVADFEALAALLDTIAAEMPALSGVVHCAGVLHDGVLQNLDDDAFRHVLAPKVLGGWNLHTLTRQLDFFVLFSSIAGVLGNAGQANYAAANAFLDALARYRRTRGLAAQSIGWGGWGVGMGASVRRSAALFDEELGATIFECVIQDSAAHVLALNGRIHAPSEGDRRCSPFYSELTSAKSPSRGQSAARGEREREATHRGDMEELAGRLRRWLAELADVAAESVALDAPLGELGIDSLATIRLRARLTERLGVAVPPAVLGASTTIEQLVASIASHSAAERRRPIERSPLVWFEPGGETPPVVFVHPIGGGVNCYAAIADALPNRSVAIESPALHSAATTLPRSMEGTAEQYLEFVAGAGVSPPFFIVGWSFGGLLAFEMACRLEQRGSTPPLLVLIDSHLHSSEDAVAPPESRSRDGRDLDLLGRFLTDVTHEPLAPERFLALAESIRERGKTGSRVEPTDLIDVAARLDLLGRLHRDDAARMFALFRSNLADADRYRPRAYGGSVLFFAAARTLLRANASEPWRELAGHLDVETLDADHYSIMTRPAVDELIDTLSARLITSSGRPLQPKSMATSRVSRDETP